MALLSIQRLLDDFHQKGIRYCHWKSNEHLDAALNADTDLDILFDQSQKEMVLDILRDNDFVFFQAAKQKRYPGISDYIGCDKHSGKIIHVHSHFRLVMGETGIKSYDFGHEKKILDSRIYDEDFKIYRTVPALEYLLLLIRTALKQEQIPYKFKQRAIDDHNREAAWLQARTTIEEIQQYTEEILGNAFAERINQLWQERTYQRKTFRRFQHQLKSAFAERRILSPLQVNLLKLRQLEEDIQKKTYRLLNIPTSISRRTLPQSGLIVSLMGADGAGKSTQVKEITAELKKKVDVSFMYMGAGDGAGAWYRKWIQAILRKGKSDGKKKATQSTTRTPVKVKRSAFREIVNGFQWIALAREKKGKLRRIEKMKKKGEIIICDRYPQTAVPGYNDGPKLSEFKDSPHMILRAMARYEHKAYAKADEIPPDLVIKLLGEPAILHQRRPEMAREEIEKKQEGIQRTTFGNATREHVVDIDKSIETIKGEILEEIFRVMGDG